MFLALVEISLREPAIRAIHIVDASEGVHTLQSGGVASAIGYAYNRRSPL